MTPAALRSELDRIDWNFPSTGTRGGSIHTAHWFPGNFIPQIPSHLIEILSKEGDVVLDPFTGSGTTVIEALKLNRSGIGRDQTRACVFVAQEKLAAYRNPLSASIREQVLSELTWPHLCESDVPGMRQEGSHPDLQKWYSGKTLRQLKFIWKLIEHIPPSQQALLKLAFSDLLFACASSGNAITSGGKTRRHHWGWVADNVFPKATVDHEAVSLFTARLLELSQSERKGIPPGLHADVGQADARHLDVPSESVDLIVTSPPYVGMIDYTLAHRLLYLWLNWDLDADKQNEIGARFKRKRRDLVDQYLSDMFSCWAEVSRVLRRRGYCAVVIGESRKYPGTALRAIESLAKYAPICWGPIERIPTRRRVSDRRATEPAEYIAVFQKP